MAHAIDPQDTAGVLGENIEGMGKHTDIVWLSRQSLQNLYFPSVSPLDEIIVDSPDARVIVFIRLDLHWRSA